MKTLIPHFFEGMACLFGAISTGKEAFFPRNSFINEDFLNQFDKEEDQELLNKTVSDLKLSKEKSREIILSNSDVVKIVVN